MRTPPYPPADMPADLRPLHDEMDAYATEHLKGFVSLLLNAYDMSVPGREEGLPDDPKEQGARA